MNARKSKVRFLGIVALLAIPSIWFGLLFVNQSQSAIDFARRELAGIEYIRAVMPLYIYSGKSGLESTEAAEQFINVRRNLDTRLKSRLYAEAVSTALQKQNSDSIKFATAALINAVADTSSLTIDPDLDSYYLAVAMFVETPRLMQAVDELIDVMSSASNVPKEFSQQATSILLKNTELESAAKKLRQAYSRSLSENYDGSLERNLSTAFETAMRAIHKISISGHRTRASLLEGQSDAHIIINAGDGTDEKMLVLASWRTMGDNLQRLISQRLQRLTNERNVMLILSAAIAVVAFFLGKSVFKTLIGELDARILFLAHHDAMTELKNRSALSSSMSVAMAKADETGTAFAIHAVDLDGFKTINDTYGHQAGDFVLQATAKRLLNLAGNYDVVGRLGGDEFVFIQGNPQNSEEVSRFASLLVSVMNCPVAVEDKLISVSASIGCAIYEIHGKTEAQLMRSADLALYAAKRAGKDRACVFCTEMEEKQSEQRELERRLRQAVQNGDFFLAYQPQYNMDGSRITGFEALLRLNGANARPISPVVFIPCLEQLGLMSKVGSWVLRNACATAVHWPSDIKLAVNISALEFAEAGAVETEIRRALDESGLPADRLEIEITESAILDHSSSLVEELNGIKSTGVSIAMDDFGTGYSCLSSLWKFPFDKIKIDKSFLVDRDDGRKSAGNVVKSIVALARSLSMSVTVEGVETLEQAKSMATLQCDQLQGFYFSRPVSSAELPIMLLNHLAAQAHEDGLMPVESA